jgi:hypothetical protein
MRMKACGWRALIVLVVSAGLGCDSRDTPLPAAPTAPPIPTVSVQLEGVVLDEGEEPVSGAVVDVEHCRSSVACNAGSVNARVTAGDQGRFVLTMNLPADWSELLLNAHAPGYDSTSIYVDPARSTATMLRLFRTLTIHPGETIQMHTFLGSYVCGFESHLCRRILVESPAGEPLDIDVAQTDGADTVGVDAGPEPLFPTFSRRVTVSGGDVFIFPGRAEGTGAFSGVLGVFEKKVTVTARPHLK